jgi:hypothetical protein
MVDKPVAFQEELCGMELFTNLKGDQVTFSEENLSALVTGQVYGDLMDNFSKSLHKSHAQLFNNGFSEENSWICNEMTYIAKTLKITKKCNN